MLFLFSFQLQQKILRPHEKRGIAWLLKEGWLEDLEDFHCWEINKSYSTAFRESFSGNLDWKWEKPPYKRFRYKKEHAIILENSAEADTNPQNRGDFNCKYVFPRFPHIPKSGIDPSKSTSQLFGRTESWKWISHHFRAATGRDWGFLRYVCLHFLVRYCRRFRSVTFAMFRKGLRRLNSS